MSSINISTNSVLLVLLVVETLLKCSRFYKLRSSFTMASLKEDGGAFVQANDVDRTSFASTSYRRHPRKLDAFLERHQETKITTVITQTTCSSSLSPQGQSHSGVIVDETDDMSSTIFPIEAHDTLSQSHRGPDDDFNPEEECHDFSSFDVNRLDVLLQKESNKTIAKVASDPAADSSTEDHLHGKDESTSLGEIDGTMSPDDANLINKWRDLYLSSRDDSEEEVNNTDEQLEFHPVETSSRCSDNDVILGTAVMLPAQEGITNKSNVAANLHSPLTIESSTHTKSTVSHHISTPREASNTSCSFSFNFLAAIFKPETGQKDDESSKENNASPIFSASSSYDSFSSESCYDRDMFAASAGSEDIELNNYYDEGENGRASMQWTFDDSEAGTGRFLTAVDNISVAQGLIKEKCIIVMFM